MRPGRLDDIVLEGFGRLDLRVLTADSGAPIAQYRVNIRQKERRGLRIRWQNPDDVDNPDGRYTRDELPPGLYTIGVVARGFAPHASEIEIFGGEPEETIVRLERGLGVTVVVVDEESDTPIAGARVSANPIRPENEQEQTSSQKLRRDLQNVGFHDNEQHTDASGTFTFDSLDDGKFHVSAHHNEYYASPRKGNAQSIVLPVDAGKEVRIPLRRAGQVKGKVKGVNFSEHRNRQLVFSRYDDETGKVALTHSTWIQDSGEFQAASLRPGTYRVSLKIRQQTEPGPDGAVSNDWTEQTLLEQLEITAGVVAEVNIDARK